MLGILVIVATCVIVYKAAEAGRRSGAMWATVTAMAAILISLLIGTLLAGIATLVVMLVAMTLANFLHDPSNA